MPEPSGPTGVVITGIAAAASLGADVEAIWRGVRATRCGIGPMPELESSPPPGGDGGQAVELPPEYCPRLPREARYLRWTIEHAIRSAGLDRDGPYPAHRKVMVLGTTLHGMRAGGRFLRSGNPDELDSFLAGATARVAVEGLGVTGGALTTCSACSSSLGAIALGVTLLETQQADVAIAGGYDAVSEYVWAGFNSLRLVAQGPLRPFCRDRQGMKVAEGYGIVILERAEDAARRGSRVRAVLAGWGESADAHHLTQPHPQGEGALRAMRQALERAGLAGDSLDLIAAHATATPDNDGAEYQALSQLLGPKLASVPVVGFKSLLGHTLGGAGAVELVMSCMALRDDVVPACANVKAEDVEFPGLNVAACRAESRPVSRTLNTSLGFGGANTCVVLTKPGTAGRSRERPTGDGNEPWITGVGIVLPGCIGLASFAEAVSKPAVVSNGTIEDSKLSDHLNARRMRRLGPYVKFTLAASAMAVRDARLEPEAIAAANAILGSMHGSADLCYDYYAQIVSEGMLAANPVLFAEGVPNAAAAHLSTTLGVKGSCQTIIGTRTAGLDALALAALRIRSGAVDTVIVVAAEAPSAIVDRVFSSDKLRDRRAIARPGAAVQPFARGIGGIALVVESRRSAAGRGVQPYSQIRDSRWACSPATHVGGLSGAIASVLSRLPDPARVITAGSNTWLDRAEQLGVRRAGLQERCTTRPQLPELFSMSPLAALVAEFTRSPSSDRFTILSGDWSGAASAVTIQGLDRRLA